MTERRIQKLWTGERKTLIPNKVSIETEKREGIWDVTLDLCSQILEEKCYCANNMLSRWNCIRPCNNSCLRQVHSYGSDEPYRLSQCSRTKIPFSSRLTTSYRTGAAHTFLFCVPLIVFHIIFFNLSSDVLCRYPCHSISLFSVGYDTKYFFICVEFDFA